MAYNPQAGDVIQGLSGLRKLRWRRSGRGKCGGYRVIYYFHDETLPVWLISAYAKSAQADLNPQERKQLRLWIDAIRTEITRKHKKR